jgi:hypothetical protein
MLSPFVVTFYRYMEMCLDVYVSRLRNMSMIMQQFGSSGKACLALPSKDMQLDVFGTLDCWQAHLVGCSGKLLPCCCEGANSALLSWQGLPCPNWQGKAKLTWQPNTPIGAHHSYTMN